MARWIAYFEDDADMQWVRAKHGQEHFDYLARHVDKIKIGGGLRNESDGPWVGGLWVLEVADRDEAAHLCEHDPYFKLGLRKSYRLMLWGKAPFYGDIVL